MRFREPAFWVGVLEAALVLLLTFGVPSLTEATVALIMAAVVAGLGFVTAALTDEPILAVGVGFAKAVLALAIAFGLPITEPQNAALLALVTVVLGAWNRGKTSPRVASAQHAA